MDQVYVWPSPFTVHLKLSQPCLLINSTAIQNTVLKIEVCRRASYEDSGRATCGSLASDGGPCADQSLFSFPGAGMLL